jgi:hypothetical protein
MVCKHNDLNIIDWANVTTDLSIILILSTQSNIVSSAFVFI